MAKMAIILCGWLSKMRETHMVLFTASPQVPILNIFRIYNRWYTGWRKSYELHGRMKNSSYFNATAGIRNSYVLNNMGWVRSPTFQPLRS